jgi:hypothetical protein
MLVSRKIKPRFCSLAKVELKLNFSNKYFAIDSVLPEPGRLKDIQSTTRFSDSKLNLKMK